MADINIAAVFRSREYSPNHIGTDAAILNEVCDQLRKRGCSVETFSEGKFIAEGSGRTSEFDAWISMARSPKSISILQDIERSGIPVINSGFGIENCRRGRMSTILAGSGIPLADFIKVDTDTAILERLKKEGYTKCWIKQADGHSKHKEDVTFVRHADEAQEILQEYFMRGIREAVICRHLSGDLIRFYGVAGTDFFKWFMPMDNRHFSPDSAGCEPPVSPSFDEQVMKSLCTTAAETLEVKIYGGDCILRPDGSLVLIDINDWPSFAPYRKAAASFIGRYVLKQLK